MAKLNKEERLNKIRIMIKDKPYLSIKDIIDTLEVSEMTIRRDLSNNELIDLKLVNGLVLKENSETNYHLDEAFKDNISAKEILANYIIGIIQENDIIALDAGSTTQQIALVLPTDKNITVLCYSYNILKTLLNRGINNIIFAGGNYHQSTQIFESDEALNIINNTRVNKAFISAAGVSYKYGITAAKNYEVRMKQAIIKCSVNKYLVFDKSKYDKVQAAYFGVIDDFDYLITNKKIDKKIINEVDKVKLKLV